MGGEHARPPLTSRENQGDSLWYAGLLGGFMIYYTMWFWVSYLPSLNIQLLKYRCTLVTLGDCEEKGIKYFIQGKVWDF